ncbi:hypothetical protein QBC34DRAFT_407133 [Podospora aff. communis PSN243]|uniref:Flavin reductase like domain-containing protein n=1 Tax=Podospora aff. communis PSN243 TaxID=3040156 RepID=A0AAV9GJF2_9PEZI|nr:hypothetical protein QBC34DRAFT_407133 [Podospora aff. communis PSN243]
MPNRRLLFRSPLPDGKRAPLARVPRLPHPHHLPERSTYKSHPTWKRSCLTFRTTTAKATFSTSSQTDRRNRSTQQSNTQSNDRPTTKMAAERSANFEAQLKRNPHPDFKKEEASRPPFDTSSTFRYTQTPDPSWVFGRGANQLEGNPHERHPHIPIDPHAEGRPSAFNYKLLISAVIPRPIAFLSTRGPDVPGQEGGGVTNLAPFSYFQMINHDPPLFVIGFTGPADVSSAKDSLRNLVQTKECVINIIGEDFVEAANSTSINAPYGKSEWNISGLNPVYSCETVPRVPRVAEAIFSIEGKLESFREFQSKATPDKTSGTMVIIEGTRFWARKDAINEDLSQLDAKVLRPMSRLGGITYGRVTEALELPRPDFKKDLGGEEGYAKLADREKAN